MIYAKGADYAVQPGTGPGNAYDDLWLQRDSLSVFSDADSDLFTDSIPESGKNRNAYSGSEALASQIDVPVHPL